MMRREDFRGKGNSISIFIIIQYPRGEFRSRGEPMAAQQATHVQHSNGIIFKMKMTFLITTRKSALIKNVFAAVMTFLFPFFRHFFNPFDRKSRFKPLAITATNGLPLDMIYLEILYEIRCGYSPEKYYLRGRSITLQFIMMRLFLSLRPFNMFIVQ